MKDLIDRQAAIDMIEEYFNGLPIAVHYDMLAMIHRLPSAQPDDWMGRNKERILQAGMEGREIEFRIGGRLFAIREKAQ